MKRSCVYSDMYQNYSIFRELATRLTKNGRKKATAEGRHCKETVSWILNNLGSVPDPATDFLYEPGISFHLLQISFCMRT